MDDRTLKEASKKEVFCPVRSMTTAPLADRCMVDTKGYRQTD